MIDEILRALLWLEPSIGGLSPQRTWFDPSPFRVGFMAEEWHCNNFHVEYIYGFVGWGVCKQSRWRHSVIVPSRWRHSEPHTRWRICVTMATLWQQQDSGYMLLWKRYGNNKMAAMRYYGNVMATTRWRLYVTMETLWQQQDGGYALLWKLIAAILLLSL